MIRTTHRKPARKAKKSYTLSPESVDFLEALRRKRRARSISFVLEEILQAARREAELATIDQSVTLLRLAFRQRGGRSQPMGRVWASRSPQGEFLSAIGPEVSASRRDLVCSFAHRPNRERKMPGCDRFARRA
jgi:hypothetical protein